MGPLIFVLPSFGSVVGTSTWVVGSYPKGCPSTTFLNSSSNGTKSSEVSLTFLYLNYYLLANRFADSGLTIMLIDLQSFFFSDTDARRRSLRELGTAISGTGYVPLNVACPTRWSARPTAATRDAGRLAKKMALARDGWLLGILNQPSQRQVILTFFFTARCRAFILKS